MKRAWTEQRLSDGSGAPWLEYTLPQFEFVLCDGPDGRYRVEFWLGCESAPCGPPRKTRKAAVNDFHKWLKRLRGDLVTVGRARIPQ